MKDRGVIPVLCALVLVGGVVFWRGLGVEKPAGGDVDYPVDNLWTATFIELSGPHLNHGIYTFFDNPLTTSELCVIVYTKGYCREHNIGDLGRSLRSGDSLHFPRGKGELRAGKMDGEKRVLLGVPLDPNSDSEEDLMAVPGIGPKTAQKIIKYRAAHGPFDSIAKLQKLLGARIKASDYFRVEN